MRLEVGRSVELGAADVAMVGFRTWSRVRESAYDHASLDMMDMHIGGKGIHLLYLSNSTDTCVKGYFGKSERTASTNLLK